MTLFSDMTANARLGWLLWAREHDWGRNARMTEDGRLTGVSCLVSHRDGSSTVERPTFTNSRDLKAWAGY
ncbi:MAG TPA: hypothetical protein VGN74_05545 [Brevundimonas sp.]|jgi:hypothetical protein|uniref:hypothetical protein n=1 Tax=Brevundimonas sp. TaxID=1871086 RepID=UPI002E114EB5|nr:hypothetical protein [Brevundimonas sp.]